jgi:hypothetical protein
MRREKNGKSERARKVEKERREREVNKSIRLRKRGGLVGKSTERETERERNEKIENSES